MTISLLLPKHPIKNLIHEMYEQEYQLAKLDDANVYLIDIDNINKLKLPTANDRTLMYYHGWMLSKEQYICLENHLAKFNYVLVNSADQYLNSHYFENWYLLAKNYTPKSLVVNSFNIDNMVDSILSFQKENNCSVFIKDSVKSLKQFGIGFIENNSTPLYILKICQQFLSIKTQANNLTGSFIIREFVNIAPNSEYRAFVLHDKLINLAPHIDNVNPIDGPDNEFVTHIINSVKINSNFYTIDFAKLTNGSWIIVEIGDGQVSSIKENSFNDLLYSFNESTLQL